MNTRSTGHSTELWWIRPMDKDLRIDESKGHLFAGDVDAMIKHINELHLQTGIAHAARRIEA